MLKPATVPLTGSDELAPRRQHSLSLERLGGAARSREGAPALGAQLSVCLAQGRQGAASLTPQTPTQIGDASGSQQAAQIAIPLHETFTALCWVSFARSGPVFLSTGAAGGAAHDHLLLTGSSRGRLRVYSYNGFVVQSQLLHNSPVRRNAQPASLRCSRHYVLVCHLLGDRP